MKYKLYLLLLAIVLVGHIPNVSAGDAVERTINPFGYAKIIDTVEKGFADYPTIKISNTFLWIETDRVAEYKLTYNTQICGELCYMEGIVNLYKNAPIFDDAKFEDIQTKKIKTSNFKYFYRVNVPSTIEQICTNGYTDLINGTVVPTTCYNQTILGKLNKWVEYDFKNLAAGTYDWRLEGTKGFYERIDAIPVNGLDFSEWAEWGAGGTITSYINASGTNITVHTFLINGTFNTSVSFNAEVLIVAAGGSGGCAYGAGGGGGGLIYQNIRLAANQNYTISVGGTTPVGAGCGSKGVKGANSSIQNTTYILQANGGGSGGAYSGDKAGGHGGSGGGATGAAGTGTAGSGTVGQGFDGGKAFDDGEGCAGGGGGSSEKGWNCTGAALPGNGGNGTNISITGTSIAYAGGGGGSRGNSAAYGKGGLGGGGRGGISADKGLVGNGTNGLGGGGGGNLETRAGTGGSGVVIIAYAQTASATMTANQTYPANLSKFTTTTVTLNVSCSGVGNNVTSVIYYLSNGSINTIGSLNTENYNASWTSGYADGSYSWNATCVGVAANASTIDLNFSKDSTNPLVIIVYPTSINYTRNVSDLNYTYVDSNPGRCWYSLDLGVTNSTSAACGTNWTGLTSADGSNTWIVYVNDSFNNMNYSRITFFKEIFNFTSTPYANKSFRVSDFIKVNGTNFTLGGLPYRLMGADSYYLTDYSTNHTYNDNGFEITNSREAVIEILNEAKYLNINVIRTWANGQGGGANGSWIINNSGGHHNLFEVGIPGNYSEEMFSAMDWLISEASKRDIRLQMVLVNNWNEYGGMRWYTQMSPTTNKTYAWINDSSDPNWDKFKDQFYNDINTRTYFRNYINYTLNRNNTVTGVLYKDDPTIFAWLLANEPRAKSDAGGVGRSLIVNWTKNMTAYIKSIDTNHLVGLGIEGFGEPFEGTDMISDHNGTGVDFATFELHPDQWDWFAQRGENGTNGVWITGGINSNSTIDWWTNDLQTSWNNRYEALFVPNYIPALARHGYQNWIQQNVNWSTNILGMPVLLQEVAMPTSLAHPLQDRFFTQTISNFFRKGGDGILVWNLNHDDYYYSTTPDGIMDDGYSFYLSNDLFLKNKSSSVISAFNFTLTNNTGGTSWVNLLNNYKYDFIFNINILDDITLSNCSLILNVSNGTWSNNYYDQTNTTAITSKVDYTFTKQFADTDVEFYWSIECCSTTSCLTTTPKYELLKGDSPLIVLSKPDTNSYLSSSIVNFNYTVTDIFDMSWCELYINDILSMTDSTVSVGIDQSFTPTAFADGIYNWSIKCKDILDNVGYSSTRNFTVDTTHPNVNLIYPLTANYNYNVVNLNYTYSDTNPDSCWYSRDLGLANSTKVAAGINWTTVTSIEGSNTWTVFCNDSANNLNQSSVTFFQDSLYPLIEFVSPTELDGSFLNRMNVLINTTATDTNLVNISTNLYSSLGIYSWATTAASPNYQNFTITLDGIYYFNSTACDSFGHCNSTLTRNTTIDTKYPTIDYGIGTLASGVNISQNSVYVNTTWTETNFQNITFRLYNSSWINSTTYIVPTYLINFTDIANGYYSYNVTICDKVSYCNTTSVRTILLDITAPTQQQGYTDGSGGSGYHVGVNGSFTNNATVNFTGNFTDAYGLTNVTIKITNASGATLNETTIETHGILSYVFGIPLYLIDGMYNWIVTAWDISSNFVTSTVMTLFVDTTLPSITSQNYTITISEFNDTFVYKLNATIIELYPNQTGINLDGVNYSIYNISATVYEYNFTKNLTYIPYQRTFYFWTIDNANNYAQSATYYVNVNCPSGWDVFNNSYCMEKMIFNIGGENKTRYLSVPNSIGGFTKGYLNLSTNLVNWTDKFENWTDKYNINGSWGFQGGMRFYLTNGKATLKSVIVDNLATYSNVSLRLTANGTNLTTGTRIGNTVILNYNLTNGTTYWLISSDDGDHQYSGAGSPTFPKDSGDIIWDRGINPTNGLEDTGNNGYDILKINLIFLRINLTIGNTNVDIRDGRTGRTDNLANYINQYLTSSYLVGSNYLIPFFFYTDNATVQYSDMLYDNLGILENSQTYNSTTYETSTENFVINLSYDYLRYTSASANLVYNGTSYPGTKVGTGNNILFTKTLGMANPAANKTFYWNISLWNGTGFEYYTSTAHNQTVQSFVFAPCSASVTLKVLNLTFIDETAGTGMNATLDASSWSYSIGGTAWKSFIFSNATHNLKYEFCILPADIPSFYSTETLQYSSAEGATYPQRKITYTNDIYRNSTLTTKSLYLLNLNNGITSTYQVISIGNQVIEGAQIFVQRIIGGTLVTLGDGFTDAAGTLFYFLNPNYEHTFTVSKAGYSTLIKSLFPSQTTYTFTLGTSSSYFMYNYTLEGITYTYWPPTGQIESSGNYNFTYTVYSRSNNILNCSFYIRTLNGTLIGSGSGCNSLYPAMGNGGTASRMINITNVSDARLIGQYYITMANNTVIIVEGGAMWSRMNVTGVNPYGTLMDAINGLKNLPEWGGECTFGYTLNETDMYCYADSGSGDHYWNRTSDFSRIVFFFLVLAVALAIVNFYTSYDTAYPGAFFYIITILVILGSFSGGLTGTGYFYLPGATAGAYFCDYSLNPIACSASKFFDNWILAILFSALSGIYFLTTNKRYQSG